MDATPQRVALITGASSGIGEATAAAFAKQGFAVVVAARRADRIADLAARITATGGVALAVPMDVTNAADRAHLIAQTLAHFGRLDVLVNNAGRGHFGRTRDVDAAGIRELFELNVIAPIMLTQLALPELRRRKGLVINVASVAGRIATPKLNIYNATKFALIGWSEATRRELRGTGVRISIVDPGPIRTEFVTAAAGPGHDPAAQPHGLPADVVARRIVRLTRHPRTEIVIPRIYRVAMALNDWFPGLLDRFTGSNAKSSAATHQPATVTTEGTVSMGDKTQSA